MRLRPTVLLVAAVALAAVLRGLDLGGFAITHWDEGLAWRGALYFQSLGGAGHYSPTHGPPLLSLALAAWTFGLGSHPAVAVWLNVLLACASVPLVYWVVRELASSRAAGIAALLLAGSGLHAMFARTLLAETLYVACLLASLGSSLRALREPRAAWFLVTGLAVACTQATKYNGCLAALPLAALLVLRFVRAPESGGIGLLALRLALLGVPVAALMAANLFVIASFGDLAAFFEHYRGYLGGSASLTTVVRTLAWVSPWALLAAAGVGALGAARLGERGWLVHVTFAIYALFLLRYTFYLRLLAPIAALLVVYAALGIDALVERRTRTARVGGIALFLALVAGQTWVRSERYYLRRFDGYPRASAWLNTQPDRSAMIFATQHFVWDELEFEPAVAGLPSTRADAILDAAAEVLLVVDVGAFSRLRPWNLNAVYPELCERFLVQRFAATLNLDVLQNNLTLAELQRLEHDPGLRERVLSIHVFRLPSDELRRLVAPGG